MLQGCCKADRAEVVDVTVLQRLTLEITWGRNLLSPCVAILVP